VKQAACIALGSLFLLMGLSAVPRFLGHVNVGEEDASILIGRALMIVFMLAAGGALVFLGIRSREQLDRSRRKNRRPPN
jgi:hypothetical protein